MFFADSLEPSAFSRKFVMSVGGQVPTAAQASFTDLYTANKEGALARYSLDDLKMVGSPFGQIHAGDKKTGKNGSKVKQGKKKTNAKANGANDKSASQGHTGAVLCLAASEDGKYLLTGGKDKVIGVWQVDSPTTDEQESVSGAAVKWLRGLAGHKDAVTVSRACNKGVCLSRRTHLSVLGTCAAIAQ